MKNAVFALLCLLVCGTISLFAQPTINGTVTPAEYQVTFANSNPVSNNGFGPQSDIGAIRTWVNGTDLYIGIPCKVEANGNQLAIWMGFSNVPGRAAGTRLSCAHTTGTYLDSTWTNNNYRADFEVDYMLSVRTDNGQVVIAKTAGANVGSQVLGTATTTASSNSAGSILSAGAATFALNNQTASDIRTTNTGFEIRFTLSALGTNAAANVRLFAIIVGANNPFFSNVLVPGTASNANLGFDPNLTSPPTGYSGPFNTGAIALPVELTSFGAQVLNDGVRLSWTTASELNNAGFEVQRSTNQANWTTLGFVRGAGTTTEAQSYSFLDASATGRVFYRLKQIDFDGQFEYSNVIEVNAGLPKTFALEQNYPNPFNPTTTIAYQLPTASDVSLKVYDMLGKEVTTLVNARQDAGAYSVNFNANNLASGLYFYRLQAGNFVQTRKMMLVK
ncbi:MAG: T9SS type A sorting domain-containing protein [Chloroherpetonaceae bacterium]|nr:T9SS type A sorting domain-containing protein [Chloroherpetonaceae bacterium]MDW8438469.1 T9SS type A sorting domain-containing protein [Chloroherpetonaceae bacterium]